MPVLAPRNQRIDGFCRFRSVSCCCFSHRRRPCPASSGINGDGKYKHLRELCALNERSEWAVKNMYSFSRIENLEPSAWV